MLMRFLNQWCSLSLNDSFKLCQTQKLNYCEFLSLQLSKKVVIFAALRKKWSSFCLHWIKNPCIHQGGIKMINFANFNVDRRGNKMAARGPHIQKFVILAATLCCDNLKISCRDKHTLNSFMKYPFQVGKWYQRRTKLFSRISTFRQDKLTSFCSD